MTGIDLFMTSLKLYLIVLLVLNHLAFYASFIILSSCVDSERLFFPFWQTHIIIISFVSLQMGNSNTCLSEDKSSSNRGHT